MHLGTILRVTLTILALGLALYFYIGKQNEITAYRLKIPVLAKEVKAIEEENIRLTFEIERFEDPSHLIEISRLPQYRHLRHPLLEEVVTVHVEATK